MQEKTLDNTNVEEVKKYGFTTEKFKDGTTQRTLVTGDGKTGFTTIFYENGNVGMGLSYGFGEGLNTTKEHESGAQITDLNVDLVVKFERHESIDAMIKTLVEIKRKLKRKVYIGDDELICLSDTLPIHYETKGIYINESKPWFHNKRCTIKSGCVAHWEAPLTEDECKEWVLKGAPESIVHWSEFVACADENLYAKLIPPKLDSKS